jgi:hypothetical protein
MEMTLQRCRTWPWTHNGLLWRFNELPGACIIPAQIYLHRKSGFFVLLIYFLVPMDLQPTYNKCPWGRICLPIYIYFWCCNLKLRIWGWECDILLKSQPKPHLTHGSVSPFSVSCSGMTSLKHHRLSSPCCHSSALVTCLQKNIASIEKKPMDHR